MHAIILSSVGEFSTGNRFPTISRYVGPYKLKHWIKKHGYDAQVIDHVLYLSQEQIYTAIKKFVTSETLVIGFSTTFTTSRKRYVWSDGSQSYMKEEILKSLIQIKKEYPNIKFVTGGYGSEHLYLGGFFDATIMSYTEASEDIFVEYLDHLKNGAPPPHSKLLMDFYHLDEEFKKKNKVKFRKHYHQARNKKYNIEVDDFKFTKEDAILPGEPLPLDISRGCIFACRFCNYPHLGKSKTDYIRGMEYVKQEILENYNLFGTTNYMVLDDTFNESPPKMEAFLRMTETLPFKIGYSAYIRADLVNRFQETAHMLKESGLFGAYFGIETMHPSASKLVGKGWNGTQEAKEFLPRLYHDLWEGKIPTVYNYIIGWPKETIDDVMNTLRWFKDSQLYSLGYERLGLTNPKFGNRYSIMSEFERNSSKYGFTFIDDPKLGREAWYNETWTPNLITEKLQQVNGFIETNKLRKMSVWTLGAFQMLGYSKEYLLTTPRADYDMDLFKQRSANIYNDYYDLLMSL